jgi:uncharacterized protein YciI
MTKQTFFVRLIPPRASFTDDITPDELALMQAHFVYTQQHFEAGQVLVFGPVFAEGGTFGMAVLNVDTIADVHTFMAGDPSIQAGLNTYEVWPMRLGGAQSARETAGFNETD